MIYVTQIMIWALAIGLSVAFYFLNRHIKRIEQEHDYRIEKLEENMGDLSELYLIAIESKQPKVEKHYISKRKEKKK